MGALALGLLVAAASCGGDGYEVSELPAIVLQASEAPEGTVHERDESGTRALREFSVSGQERLQGEGFVDGYATVFGPTGGVTTHLEVTSGAMVFEDGSGAEASMAVVLQDVEGRLIEATEMSADGLGAESAGLSGPVEGDARQRSALLYVWRTDNLVLFVIASALLESAPSPEVILGLAETMDSRAS
ncbi:MAG TPA: hypothetical protein VF058_06100 [Actinomycetota bacterium]